MKSIQWVVLAFCAAGTLAYAGIVQNLNPGEAFPIEDLRKMSALTDQAAPDLAAGKPTIVVYWASWCPHCRIQNTHMAELYSKYSSQGLRVIGIDGDQDRSKGLEYAKAHLPFPSVYDEGKQFYSKLGIRGIPVTFILDEKNKVTRIIGGESTGMDGPIAAAARAAVGAKE